MTDHEVFREATPRVRGTLDLRVALRDPFDGIRLNILDRHLHAVMTVANADRRGSKDLPRNPAVLPFFQGADEQLAGPALPDIRIAARGEEDRAASETRRSRFADPAAGEAARHRNAAPAQRSRSAARRAGRGGAHAEAPQRRRATRR